jgi:UDP-3-O-[3-hydroxymyristoyl] glucosamine N-acyltransferase
MPILLKFFKPKTKNPVKNIEDSSVIGKDTFVGPGSYIGHNVILGDNCYIYPNVTIMEGVVIGDNTIIYPGAVVREFCKLGKNVVIQPCAVIGSDGFGFVKVGGHNIKIEQIGIVEIQDNVEIGANTTIDRGTIGNTIIKKGTKLDNLVHIAHNVVIGEEGLIIAQVGIAGSTEVGKNIIIGGQSGITGHIKVGDNVTVGSRSGIASHTKGNQVVAGFPAIDYNTDRKVKVSLKRLPEMLKRLRKIEEKLEIGDKNEEN